MTRVRTLWLVLPKWIRRFPADLAAVLAIVGLTWASVTFPPIRESVLRTVVGTLFVLFVPGYAITAALFPDASSGERDDRRGDTLFPRPGASIRGIERVVLSVGLSVLLVPMVAFLLNFTEWGVTFGAVMVSLSGLALVLTAVAALCRWETPPERRFEVPVREWIGGVVGAGLPETESSADFVLNLVIAGAVLVAVASVSYAVVAPNEGGFTEFSLLTRNETGDLAASDYPTEFVAGESRPVVVGIDNHERERVSYSVVVELQRVAPENESNRVLAERELDRLRVELGPGESWRNDYDVVPTLTGDRLRLQFLLYRGTPPDEPRSETAYRRTHLWVNVSDSNRRANGSRPEARRGPSALEPSQTEGAFRPSTETSKRVMWHTPI